MELQKGRPADTAGRLEKEIRTYDLLDRLGVTYERVDHAPAMTMEVCQEIDQTLQAVICKNLFLCNRQETAFLSADDPGHEGFSIQRICLHRSARRACPLPSRNTWKSFWILRPARSACWD